MTSVNPQRTKQEELRAQATKTIQARYKESSRNLFVGNAAGISLVGPILGGLAFSNADTQLPISLVLALTFFIFGAFCSQSAVVSQYFAFGMKASLELTSAHELQTESERYSRLRDLRDVFFRVDAFYVGASQVLMLLGAVVVLGWIWVAALT